MTLGQKIKKVRQGRGHTQDDAATRVRVNVLTWARWERGQMPTLPHAFRLADYLDLKLDQLRRYVDQAN